MRTIPSQRGRKYGYHQRKHKNMFLPRYAARFAIVREQIVLPPSVDLRPQCPPIYDQGELGSCTANAIAAAYAVARGKSGLLPINPSRLFIYFNERAAEGHPLEDTGAFGGDGMTSLKTIGVPDETCWPYLEDEFRFQPNAAAYIAAAQNKITTSEVLYLLLEIKHALASGYTVAFGISLYESFEITETFTTGIVPDPKPDEGFLGGHEMLIVGYDDAKESVIVRNSWGTAFGMGGYCLISYNYLMLAGSDFEAITQI